MRMGTKMPFSNYHVTLSATCHIDIFIGFIGENGKFSVLKQMVTWSVFLIDRS